MTKTAEQIAEELHARSWMLKEPVDQRNLMRRIASILRYGPFIKPKPKECTCSCHGRGFGEPPCGACWGRCK